MLAKRIQFQIIKLGILVDTIDTYKINEHLNMVIKFHLFL